MITKAPTPSLEFLRDVCITAAEGGINYWCEVVKYRWSADGTLANILPFPDLVVEFENARNDGKETRTIDADILRRGIRRIANTQFNINPSMREHILEAVKEDDAGMIDVEDADCIVQAGIFDELVYG